MITENFNTGRLVTTPPSPQNTQRLLPLWKITLGQGLSPLLKKNAKTAINSDSVETKINSKPSQTYKKRGRVRQSRS